MTRRRAAAIARTLAVLLLSVTSAPSALSAAEEATQHPARREFLDYKPPAGLSLLSWFDQEHMLGDLGGVRSALARLGITPTLTFVVDAQGNPMGGERQGFRGFENLGLDVTVDLGRAVGLAGGEFHLSASYRSGESLTNRDIGNVFNVAQVCCGATFRLVDVSYQQSFFDDRLNVRIGRIAAGDEFLSSPLYWLFVQNGFDGNPVGIFKTTQGFTAYPTATWGLRVRAKPVEDVYVMAAVFNGDPTLGDNDKHGADWSFDGRLFAIVEAGWRTNQRAGATGLPGNYKVGAWYDDSTFADFSSQIPGVPQRTTRGNAGFYLLADQMVYRPGGPGTKRGLTPFVSILVAPNSDISTFPLFVNGGLVYRGPFAARPGDTATFGVIYGRFSEKLRDAQRASGAGVQSDEIALEWSYIIALAPWLRIQPDIQYIIRPGGTGRIPNALVLGFQAAVSF